MVVAGPVKPLLPVEVESLKKYVERGGKLMLLQDPQDFFAPITGQNSREKTPIAKEQSKFGLLGYLHGRCSFRCVQWYHISKNPETIPLISRKMISCRQDVV